MSTKKRKFDGESSDQTQPPHKRRKLTITSTADTKHQKEDTNEIIEQKSIYIFNCFQSINDIIQHFLEYLGSLDILSVLKATNHVNEKQLVINKFKEMYKYPLPTDTYHKIELDIQIVGQLKEEFNESKEIESIKQQYLKYHKYHNLDFTFIKIDIKHTFENDISNMQISMSLDWKDDTYYAEYILEKWFEEYINVSFKSHKTFQVSKPMHTKLFTEIEAYDDEYCSQHRIPIALDTLDYTRMIHESIYPFVIVYITDESGFKCEIYKYNQVNDEYTFIRKFHSLCFYEYNLFTDDAKNIYNIDAKMFDNHLNIIYHNVIIIIDINGNISKTFQFNENENENVYFDQFELGETVIINPNGILEKACDNDLTDAYEDGVLNEMYGYSDDDDEGNCKKEEKPSEILVYVRFMAKDVIFHCGNDYFKTLKFDRKNGNVIDEQSVENVKEMQCLQVTNNQYLFMFDRKSKMVYIYKYLLESNKLNLHNKVKVNKNNDPSVSIAIDPFDGTSLISATFNPVRKNGDIQIKSGDLNVESIRLDENMKVISTKRFTKKCIADAVDGHEFASYLEKVEFISDDICAILIGNGELFIFCNYDTDGMQAGFMHHHYINFMEAKQCSEIKYIKGKIWMWQGYRGMDTREPCTPIMFDMHK